MQEKVIDLIEQFCDVLRTNYQEYSIACHRKHLDDPETQEWHLEQINKLAMGEGVDEYVYEKGRKYARIVHVSKPSNQRSAHAFVDLNTGDVYKSGSHHVYESLPLVRSTCDAKPEEGLTTNKGENNGRRIPRVRLRR